MLKRVDPSQVRLGMFIHSFDGRWLSHPFWRSQFHVVDPDELERVRASKLRAVIIDDAKSIDRAVAADMPLTPICLVDDGVPARLPRTGVSASPPGAAIAESQSLLTRSVSPTVAESDGSPSAIAERAEVVRAFGESTRAVRQAFEGVAQGHSVSLAALTSVIDQISDVMTRSRAVMIGISRLKSKDEYTFYHSVAVGALMLGFARELALDEEIARALALAGLVHDVGKMKIPDAILNKPSALTDDEFAQMRRHPELGHEMLAVDEGACPIVLEVALRHHERLDGKGYPSGWSGDQLSLYVRMAGICDVFDALTSARVYKDAMPSHQAITMMASWEGQFDRDLLIVFMRSIGLYSTGMIVRLSSDRLGLVLPPGNRPGRPRVRVFHCAIEDRPLPPSDVVLPENGRGERVVSEELAENWAIQDWSALRDRLLATHGRRSA